MKFSGYIGQDTRNDLENLGSGILTSSIQGFFLHFSKKSVSVSNIAEKRINGFSWFFRNGRIWDKKQSKTFSDLAVNPLNPGSIFFIFSGSVLVSNVMGKCVSGFSLIFHGMSGTIASCLSPIEHDVILCIHHYCACFSFSGDLYASGQIWP